MLSSMLWRSDDTTITERLIQLIEECQGPIMLHVAGEGERIGTDGSRRLAGLTEEDSLELSHFPELISIRYIRYDFRGRDVNSDSILIRLYLWGI